MVDVFLAGKRVLLRVRLEESVLRERLLPDRFHFSIDSFVGVFGEDEDVVALKDELDNERVRGDALARLRTGAMPITVPTPFEVANTCNFLKPNDNFLQTATASVTVSGSLACLATYFAANMRSRMTETLSDTFPTMRLVVSRT